MRIIYLHGWGGKRDEAKLQILSKFGDYVEYPELDYSRNKGLINNIADMASGHNSLLIGTSLGGYIAYYASNLANKPALLINPAFYLKDGGELRHNGIKSSNDKHFLISKKDEVLDIRRTLKFLNELGVDKDNISIYDDLTHQIPLDVFEKAFTEFRNKYFKIFEDQNKNSERLKEKKLINSRYGTFYYNDEQAVP